MGPPAFGEAVLGASNPALATITKTATIRNNGNDCLQITAIADNAPYSLTAASRAVLPVTLDPNQTFDVDIVFAPATTGNFSRQLAVTTVPAAGANQISCSGSARNAQASIATSTNTLAFGTVVLPNTDTRTFTVTNNGEIDLLITIAAAPGGSDFTWTPIPGPGLPLAVGATTTPARAVNFPPSADGPSMPRTITVTPTQGAAARNINCTGAGCIPNALIAFPAAQPSDFGQIERGFRTVRVVEITNNGDDDLTFRARITPGANPAQAAHFGLVLPEGDITDAPAQRNYTVPPAVRCGPGPTGNNVMPVAVSFFADGATGPFAANLVIDNHNATNGPPNATRQLTAEIIDRVPVDVALVLDRSGSMADALGGRNKMEAALAGGKLLVQMLRADAQDRCAIIGFSTSPSTDQPIELAGPNRAALTAILAPPAFTPNGWTNIAGGAILGAVELATPHPAAPPVLKKSMIVLTDGIENRCFQEGGTGPWLSITGRDPPADMARPDGTPQSTDPWSPPAGAKVYAIGLGAPGDIDSAALTQLASATGASYQGAEDLTGKSWFLLEKYFTQIFMDSAGLGQISDPFYTIAPGATHTHEFDILPGDVNCMVVIYDMAGQRLPFHILTPKGEIIGGNSLPPGFALQIRSSPTARMVEVKFPAKEPDRYVGRWQVVISHQGYVCSGDVGKDPADGFLPGKCEKSKSPVDYGIAIGAGSNLRLQPWVDPVTTYVGDSFRLNCDLAEAGLPVTDADVRVVITGPTGTSWTLPLRDDGASQDGSAQDGDYGGRFDQTYTAGNYQLTFTADGVRRGQPYHREAHRTKPVFDKRKPPYDGGGKDDCCRLLLRFIEQTPLGKRLMEEAIASAPADPKDAPRSGASKPARPSASKRK